MTGQPPALVKTRVVVLEAMADNAHPQAGEIYATLPVGLVPTDGPGSIAPDTRRAGYHAG